MATDRHCKQRESHWSPYSKDQGSASFQSRDPAAAKRSLSPSSKSDGFVELKRMKGEDGAVTVCLRDIELSPPPSGYTKTSDFTLMTSRLPGSTSEGTADSHSTVGTPSDTSSLGTMVPASLEVREGQTKIWLVILSVGRQQSLQNNRGGSAIIRFDRAW